MQHLASPAPGASPQIYDSAPTTTVYVAIVVTMCPLIFYTGVNMQSKKILSQSIFPDRIWVKTSKTPMCSNPNCCSNNSFVHNNADSRHTYNAYTCLGGQHNEHCCKAEANKTCSPRDWRVLYRQVEPEWEDIVRREWMTRWMRGQSTLHEAVTGFEEEWGSYEELEQRVAA
jgi:hypothetical protein